MGGKISLSSAAFDVKPIFYNDSNLGLAADIEISEPYIYSFQSADLTLAALLTYQPIDFAAVTLVPKFRLMGMAYPMIGGSIVLSLYHSEKFSLLFDISYITFLNKQDTNTGNAMDDFANDAFNSFDVLSISAGVQF